MKNTEIENLYLNSYNYYMIIQIIGVRCNKVLEINKPFKMNNE